MKMVIKLHKQEQSGIQYIVNSVYNESGRKEGTLQYVPSTMEQGHTVNINNRLYIVIKSWQSTKSKYQYNGEPLVSYYELEPFYQKTDWDLGDII